VIEHIDKPIDFIESIVKLLKPGGYAIITTPNKSIYPSDLIWGTELPPVHCWWFSEESMKYLANKYGLNLRFLNFKNFYKNNYRPIDLNLNYDNPVLNEVGELISQSIIQQNSIKTSVRLLISAIPFFEKVYINIKKTLNPKVLTCEESGIVLCSIFQN